MSVALVAAERCGVECYQDEVAAHMAGAHSLTVDLLLARTGNRRCEWLRFESSISEAHSIRREHGFGGQTVRAGGVHAFVLHTKIPHREAFEV